MTLALISGAHASATRTFISGAGNDSNASMNCARLTPCRTLQVALGVTTLPGGEIDALDAAGYGSISTTLTSSITILGVPGAAISVPASGAGITINAPGNTVIVDSFHFTGGGASSSTGVTLNGGNLVMRNSVLKMLTTGLAVNSAHATLLNVDVIGNGTGITTTGTGLQPNDGVNTGVTEVLLDGGSVINNTTAFFMNGPGLDGDSDPQVTILIFAIGSGLTTSISGNTTAVSGTGTGCPCSNLGTYQSLNNPH